MSLDILPTGWAQATLADVCVIERGVTFPASAKHTDPSDDAIVCLRTANVQDTVDWNDLIYIPRHYVKSDAKQVRYSDILMSTANSRELVGKVAFVSHVPVPSTLGGFIAALRPNELVESRYLFYFLRCRTTQESLRSRASQTVNIANLSLTGLYSLPVVVAPLAEQRRIVAAIEEQFTRLDAGVAALKRAQAALKRYRAAVLKAAVEGTLTEAWRAAHPDVEPASAMLGRILAERRAKWEADLRAKGKDPAKARYEEPQPPQTEGRPELPQGWVWATVEQLGLADRPCAYGVLQPGPDMAGGIPLVRVGDVNDGQVRMDALKQIAPEIANAYPRTRLQGGEVLITLVGTIGRTAVVSPELAGANTARAVGVIPLVSMVSARWVEVYFRSPDKVHEMTQAAHEVARKTLNLEDVRAATVALPPLAEQEQGVAEVEQRLSVVSAIEATVVANLKRAERLRQAILERAFTGRLVPHDLSDEPANLLLERIQAHASMTGNGQRRDDSSTEGSHLAHVGALQQEALWTE